MADLDEATKEKLVLERERLRFERQKFAAELALKRREAKASKKPSLLLTMLANPLGLPIVGAFLTLMIGIVTTTYTASQNRTAEAQRAEHARIAARDTLQADLIKKFVEGPSTTVVRENLKFLVDVGLLPTYAAEIRAYLKENPDSAPQLGLSSLALPADEAVRIDGLPLSDPLRTIGRSVGRLVALDKHQACTAFLVATDVVANAGRCTTAHAPAMTFMLGEFRAEATLMDSKPSMNPNVAGGYSLYRLARTPSIAPLQLSKKAPTEGERLMIVMFRDSDVQLAIRSPGCRVTTVTSDTFEHGCSYTGPGTGGAPILSAETGEVVGINAVGGPLSAWATRVDTLAAKLSK